MTTGKKCDALRKLKDLAKIQQACSKKTFTFLSNKRRRLINKLLWVVMLLISGQRIRIKMWKFKIRDAKLYVGMRWTYRADTFLPLCSVVDPEPGRIRIQWSAWIRIRIRIRNPDPEWIRIHWGAWIRIRIRIRNPDPDLGGQKWPRKI